MLESAKAAAAIREQKEREQQVVERGRRANVEVAAAAAKPSPAEQQMLRGLISKTAEAVQAVNKDKVRVLQMKGDPWPPRQR